MGALQNKMGHSALAQMPELSRWFLSQQKPATLAEPISFHLWSLIRALRSDDLSRCRVWTDAVSLLLDSCPATLDHILETDALVNSLGYSLTDIYTPLAESAILSGEGSKAFYIFQKLADLSGLAAFRFLAAWTAFNDEKLQVCIAECEKSTEPFAPIHTLLGQAFLETGQVQEAIDALKVATKIDPSDLIPKVQLIKAYLVIGIPVEAMRVVDECRKIVGTNIEIECLAAMAIMAGPGQRPEFAERTLQQFGKHLEHQPSDFEAFALAMDVASKLSRKDWCHAFSKTLDLRDQSNMASVLAKLPGILKKMNDLRWHDIAQTIIDKTLVVTQLGSRGNSFTQ